MLNKPRPLFSVIIPLFNKEKEIARSIQSVLLQTVGDYEIIVVDDGSTDQGPNIVRSFESSALRIVTQPNAGECAARNTGIEHAAGQLVALLDADDEWYPGFLGSIAGLAAQYPEAGAYATAFAIQKGPGVVHRARTKGVPTENWRGILPDYYNTRNTMWSSSVAIRREVFAHVGHFRTGLRLGGDLDMWFRIAAYYRIAYTAELGAIWHWDASNRACASLMPTELLFLNASLIQMEGDPSLSAQSKLRARDYAARTQLLALTPLLLNRGLGANAREMLVVVRRRHGIGLAWAVAYLTVMVPLPLRQAYLALRRYAVRLACRLRPLAAPHTMTCADSHDA